MTETSPADPPATPPGHQDSEQDSVAFQDPAYRAAAVDLLGAITYGEISAFERLAEDAKLAEALTDKLALGKMATIQFGHVEPLLERIAARHGVSPAQVVLRWHVQNGVVVIPKSVTPERIRENIDVFGFVLDDEDLAGIRALATGERTGRDPRLD